MKKTLSFILVFALILSFVPTSVFAAPPAEETAKSTIEEPTPEMMEAMIKKVRPLIVVPEEYKDFSWDFRTGYNSNPSTWYFSWSGENGEISVECDTEGRIFGYHVYDYKSERKTVLPEVSPESLLPKALEFTQKIAPHLKGLDLRLENVSTGSIFYGHTYTYSFTRYENNIPVPQNVMSVTVNYITGEVTSFSSNIILGIDFEKSSGGIDSEKAKELLSSVQDMTLSYRMKTEYDDDGKLISRKAYLVYTPTLSYVSVDADTGKVYTERDTWEVVANKNMAAGGVLMDSMSREESADAESSYQLSEEELAQLAVLESLISKDEAANVILGDSDLYIPENAYLADARLTKRNYGVKPLMANGNEENNERYTWNLYFLTPGEERFGINATVDAHDSKLMNYSAELPYVYHYEQYGIEVPTLKISKDEAVKIASDFIKKHEAEKFESVVYSATSEYAPMKYLEDAKGNSIPLYRAGRLNFVRQNENIDFTYNNFSIGVDYATGKITNYYYTWFDDVVFESPKDAIGNKEALMALYSHDGFGLNFEINRNYTYIDGVKNSVDYEVYARAVYSLYSAPYTTIRALDGKLIDYSGEEIIPDGFTGEYSDIQGHWAEKEIKKFAWIGFGPDGDKFSPSEKISSKEFTELLSLIRIYGNTETSKESETLTRMDAVKLIIDYLGYTKIAKLKNVFITDFADNSDFMAEDIGYAAIARGFGLIEGDGENFRPYDTLTRAEAVTIADNIVALSLAD